MTRERGRFFAIAGLVLVALFGAQALAYVDVRNEPGPSASPVDPDAMADDETTEPDVSETTPEATATVAESDESAQPTPTESDVTASPPPDDEEDDDRVASTDDDTTDGGLPMTGSPVLPWTALGGLLVATGIVALVPTAPAVRAARPPFWLELDDL